MLTDSIEGLRRKENVNPYEDKLICDYFSWDKGDCSPIGIFVVIFKFMLAKELSDGWTDKNIDKMQSLLDMLDDGLY